VKKLKLRFNGEGEVRIQEGMVMILSKGQIIDVPDEVAEKLMKKNPEFESAKPQIKKIKTINMEDKK